MPSHRAFSAEVVPYPRSERFARAVQNAGFERELYLHQDTRHYLAQADITPETAERYRRLAAYLAFHLREDDGPRTNDKGRTTSERFSAWHAG